MKNIVWVAGWAGIVIGMVAGIETAAAESIPVTLEFPAPVATAATDGWTDLRMPPGCQLDAQPARPALPRQNLLYALPPDADPDSVTVAVSDMELVEVVLAQPVRPVPPLRTAGAPDADESYAGALNVVNGCDQAVYSADAEYPAAPVWIDSQPKIRGCSMVRVAVAPVSYNPVQGRLRAIRRIEFTIDYARRATKQSVETMLDPSVPNLVANPDMAAAWYRPVGRQAINATSGTVFVIMTTDAIYSESTNLYGLVSHKRALGYTVHVVTETQLNGQAASNGWNEVTGQAPDGKADRIRKWLQDYYVAMQIRYVLLIGNPEPVAGDLPMKLCYPTGNEGSYYDYPADGYYSDLTGNWDLDGDQVYGEETGDSGVGGVDFAAEVWVGRIPVYTSVSGWQTMLKNIIWKSIKYELESSINWRKTALLPESWSDYFTDGAFLGECARTNYLAGKGYTAYTLYQQGSVDTNYNSVFASSEELRGNATATHWKNNGYGLTLWWGHGWPQGAAVQADGTLMGSYQCPLLKNEKPAVVFMVSCSCADPAYDDNISYTMLQNGGIASVAATEVSWYYYCSWSPADSKGMNASMGYDFMRKVTSNEVSFGQALAEVKAEVAGWWNNLFTFNLYGDPSLAITSQGADTDSDGMPDLWESAHSLVSTNPADAGTDADSDGYSNADEYRSGTNPRATDSPASAYVSMSVAGSFNGWNAAANNMRRTADYLWQADLALTNVAAAEFKFTANSNWSTNWGDDAQVAFGLPLCLFGDLGGGNIATTNLLNGRYRFTLNEQSTVYRLEPAPELDTDSDGMPDTWETAHSLNPNSSADAASDPDHDGFSNLQEYLNNQDPAVWNRPLSGLAALSVAGTFNSWNPAASNMCLVSNYVWRLDATFASAAGVEFKFAGNGGWAANWGDANQSQFTVPMAGAGDAGAGNIVVSNTLNGAYRFTFNEQDLAYRLESIATRDTDADGMPDDWETDNELDPLSARDAYEDDDSDGLANRDESASGGDPNDADTDDDGASDRAEFIAGTELGDAQSLFAANPVVAPTNYTISWPGATGRVYDLYLGTGSLAGITWTPVAGRTNLAGQAGLMSATVPPAASAAGYYRVKVRR